MEAKDKAKELVEKFMDYVYEHPIRNSNEDYPEWNAKKCALICVDEIILENERLDLGYADSNEIGALMNDRYYYLKSVKQEIELL